MRIDETQRFRRSFKQRISPYSDLKREFRESLELFIENPQNPGLKDHALTGTMYGYRSFLVAQDLIIVYSRTEKAIVLYDIGSHNQVYSK